MLPLATFAASAAVGVGKSIVNALASDNSKTLSDAAKTASETKARKTANDFESMFLENSMEELTKSEGTEGPLGENGTGGGVWRSMLSKEYAGSIVKSGGVGIADQVYREILKLQEAGNGGK
ncbi:rod-binding protein [Methylobacterium organophilum]|uniref:Flagellar protein FlgJ N-terminal domain-containing protein n=1 Tax=Methylobacterium organophilum TaxID=410 RepID=A0ABQ4TA36_METOR|nr:rod-binding protein [Methylobacterium organophilum]UMY15854.1 rod-binding protein [Methylobacterium organophilum]GJE28530.1 hypothetical protein LKMONMHP_3402 [Methylobacterium organophilum]